MDTTLDTEKSSLQQEPMKEKAFGKLFSKAMLLPGVFMLQELIFHLYIFRSIGGNIAFPLLFSVGWGLLLTAILSLFHGKLQKGLSIAAAVISAVLFSVQLVFYHIFKTFLSVYSIGANGGDVVEFWKEALEGILEALPGILLLFVPAVCYILIIRKIPLEKNTWKEPAACAASSITLYLITLLLLLLPGKNSHSPYDLYFGSFIMDLSMEKLGVGTSVLFDLKQVLFGEDELDQLAFVELPSENNKEIQTPDSGKDTPDTTGGKQKPEGDGSAGTPTVTLTPAPSPTPTQIPVDTSPNVLDLDFAALAEQESNKNIRTLHEYFAKAVPTKKNEYTGLFEGYNLILITAEGYSPWAVDKEITPTLYKLTHEGFVFENFYTPIWWTSTSDGEYVVCTGLIPYGTNSFTKSAEHAMPFGFGWQFGNLGYTAKAYHNHSYTYYHRNLTHPNMGYEFIAPEHGMEITKRWPESDLEMMENTIPQYIGEEPFHIYYMTVSGHMNYNFEGNSMSYKNRDYVKDLPYGESGKAYIACQKELDLALEYLLAQLEEAGIADRTVIALSADHYPYGLELDEISELAGHEVEENFELYKNNFILWSGSIKEPIVVDKYCSSLDIAPTLLNLFGIEYDSRLYMGQDIFSDSSPLVMFSNRSFITDRAWYNSKTGEVKNISGKELPEEYIKQLNAVVRSKFTVSQGILQNDYFSYLLPYLKQNEE